MNCLEINRQLVAFSQNRLRQDEAEPVRVHLKQCSACRDEYLLLNKTSALLHVCLCETEPPASLVACVMAKLPAVVQTREKSWFEFPAWFPAQFNPALAGSLAVVLLVVSLFVVWSPITPAKMASLSLSQNQQLYSKTQWVNFLARSQDESSDPFPEFIFAQQNSKPEKAVAATTTSSVARIVHEVNLNSNTGVDRVVCEFNLKSL